MREMIWDRLVAWSLVNYIVMLHLFLFYSSILLVLLQTMHKAKTDVMGNVKEDIWYSSFDDWIYVFNQEAVTALTTIIWKSG